MYVRFRYSGKNPTRFAVFWRISVRFSGFRTPLTPPSNCYSTFFMVTNPVNLIRRWNIYFFIAALSRMFGQGIRVSNSGLFRRRLSRTSAILGPTLSSDPGVISCLATLRARKQSGHGRARHKTSRSNTEWVQYNGVKIKKYILINKCIYN